MAAAEAVWSEAVSSLDFQAAVAALDETVREEVRRAVEAIERDPSPTLLNREALDPESDYAALVDHPSELVGFVVDGSVDDHAILYRIADGGAATELWDLFHIPGHRAWRSAMDPR